MPKHPTEIELKKLKIDPMNVRQDHQPDPEIMASIAAVGVLEPLMVRPNGNAYLVTNGGIRLACLHQLAKDGKIEPEYMVPINVTNRDDKEAKEASLIANFRVPMHEADEFLAYEHLQKKFKMKPADIASRFGISEARVNRRLALGALHPDVLQAWRDDEFEDARVARAFTLAPDKESQVKALKQFRKSPSTRRSDGDKIGYYQVTRYFDASGNEGNMVEFVGIAEYEKRGGKIRRDLFGSDHVVEDHKLLKVMVEEKLEAIREGLRKSGWSFAIARPNDYYNYGDQKKNGARFTKEENDEIAKLKPLVDSEDETPEVLAAQKRYDEILFAGLDRSYSAEQKAKGGAFVFIDHNGNLNIELGKLKPAEARAAARAESKPKAKAGEKAKPAPAKISNALVERMSEQLTEATARVLGGSPSIALAAILAGFASEEYNGSISVSARGLQRRKTHSFRKLKFEGAFATFLKMNDQKKLQALAEVAAGALDFGSFGGENPMKRKATAAIVNMLDPKSFQAAMQSIFDRKDYFHSAPKKFVLAAIEEGVNKDEARKISGKSRDEIGKFAEKNVPAGWLPAELRHEGYKLKR